MDPYDLLNMDPSNQQQMLADLLRRRQAGQSMQDANSQANRFSNMAAISQMANNPGLANAAEAAHKQSVAQYKPLQMGQQGFTLPGSGEFVSSPMYEDEKNAQRGQARDLARERDDTRRAQYLQQAQLAHDKMEQQAREGEQNRMLRGTLASMAEDGRNSRAEARLASTGVAATKADLAKQKTLDAQLAKYTSSLEKGNIPAIMSGMAKVSGVLSKYKPGEDIPGYGAVTNMLPNMMITGEGKDNRTDMQLTANAILKGLSGAAVTNSESIRFLTAVGSGAGMTSDQLRKGWANVHDELTSKRKNFNAQMPQEAHDEYRARGGENYQDYSPAAWTQKARPGDKFLK